MKRLNRAFAYSLREAASRVEKEGEVPTADTLLTRLKTSLECDVYCEGLLARQEAAKEFRNWDADGREVSE